MLVARSASALRVRSLAARAIVGSCAYSKDYASSSDDEKDHKKQKPAKAATPADNKEDSAANRLNRLLASMQTDDKHAFTKQVSMAKPGEAHKKIKQQAKQAAAHNDVFDAAKRVASMLGDENKNQTESELLSKLLGHTRVEAVANEEVTEAVSPANESELSLSDLIVGMKIDRRQQPKGPDTRADFVRRALASKQQQTQADYRQRSRSNPRPERKREAESYTGSVNLFGAQPLGIFSDPTKLEQCADPLSTWSHLQQRHLKMQVMHPPANYFDKMALWTEQGKVWRFPIDNQRDIYAEEENVDFSEHIFLEQHLEDWCPTKGPIRHFMELVCVGLSKNPYITAREKKEHIFWYRDYFETKKDILRDLMSQDKMEAITATKSKIAES